MSTENTDTIVLSPDSGPDIETLDRADALAIWEDYRSKLEKLKTTAETLVVTDASQVAEMKLARATRLTLKDLRVSIEKKRKELGEAYLRKTQRINADAKTLKDLIEPLEERLLEQEKFAERAEEKRKAELKATREAILKPFGVDTILYPLSDMPEEEFQKLATGLKAAHEAELEAERKAEEERQAKAKAEAEERERIRLENERLKKEAEERERAAAEERERARKEREAIEEKARQERAAIEAAAAAERKKAEAARKAAEEQARKEREARERIEAEERSRREREEAEKKAAEEAARKAAAAPDRDKLEAFAKSLRALTLPELTTDGGKAASTEVRAKIQKFAAWVEGLAASI